MTGSVLLVTAQQGPKSKRTNVLQVVCTRVNGVETTPHSGNELIIIISWKETDGGSVCVCVKGVGVQEFIYSRQANISHILYQHATLAELLLLVNASCI